MSLKRFRSIRETQPYIYADISLEFELKREPLSGREFKMIIMSAMHSLHGDFGAAKSVDILKFRPTDSRAYIRFQAKDLVYLRSGLGLFSSWDQLSCAFRFNKISHSLSSLSIESFHQQHNIVKD